MAENSTLFGINLRNAITRKGLTFGKAAAEIGVSLSFLNMLMSGEKNPSVETLSSICSVLEISRAELYEEEIRPRPPVTVGEVSVDELAVTVANKVVERMNPIQDPARKPLLDLAGSIPLDRIPEAIIALRAFTKGALKKSQPRARRS
jgi:transcriptional regulator with XRE-family HTH domain